MSRIVIFDWDDTLFPSVLHRDNESKISDNSDNCAIDDQIVFILSTILEDKNNLFFIITNSEHGWIEFSSQKYLPRTHQWLNENAIILQNTTNVTNVTNVKDESNKLKILSAYSFYKDIHPDNQILWKIQAFRKVVQDCLNSTNSTNLSQITQIIAIGDGVQERIAMKHLAKEFKDYKFIFKFIQFINLPQQIEMIIGQLRQIGENLKLIYECVTTFDLRLNEKYFFAVQNEDFIV